MTKEAERSRAGGGDQRPLSAPPPASLNFEELQSASVLFANDLWTEEDEWEGSLWDILKGEGRRGGMNETDKSRGKEIQCS